MKAVLKAENRELKVEHRELKAEHQELKSKFNILEKQMAEIHQFTIPRIPRSSNFDQDSGLIVRSQGTNSTVNNNIKEIFPKNNSNKNFLQITIRMHLFHRILRMK